MKNLVGRKVKGFKFDKDNVYDYTFDRKVGEIGRIAGVFGGWCTVHFIDDILVYPLGQIEDHLVPEWEIGKEYEFSDDGESWDEPQELIGIIEHEYKYMVDNGGGCFNGYKQIREIKPKVKETNIIYFNEKGERVILTIQGELFKIEEKTIKK